MSAESGSESIDIKATAARILEVVSDLEAYPKWNEEFKEATVLDRDANGRPTRAAFVLDAKIKTVKYTLDYTYPPDGVAWVNEEGGDVKLIKGSYALAESGGTTTVTYNFEIDPGFPVPSFIRRQAVKMIVSRALGGLKKRSESGE